VNDRELTPRAAATLAGLAADAEWTRSGLEVAFAHFMPERASWLAARIINLYPNPPFDEASIFGLLRDLPFISEPSASSQRPNTSSGFKPWRFEVPRYESTGQLARSLDLTISEIEWFADLQGRLRTAPFPLQHYRSARLDKRQGIRLLEVPKPRLREIQRKILHRILDRIPPHPAAHGFRKGRSPRTFATPHAEREVVVSVDLRRFFPSIGFDRVVAIFEAVGYRRKVAANLAALCTTVTPAGELTGMDRATAARLRTTHLPQGAPTSPALANLVALPANLIYELPGSPAPWVPATPATPTTWRSPVRPSSMSTSCCGWCPRSRTTRASRFIPTKPECGARINANSSPGWW
jgi:RNA-directed DNA polymerase